MPRCQDLAIFVTDRRTDGQTDYFNPVHACGVIIIAGSGFHSNTIPGIEFSCSNWIMGSISINTVYAVYGNRMHVRMEC